MPRNDRRKLIPEDVFSDDGSGDLSAFNLPSVNIQEIDRLGFGSPALAVVRRDENGAIKVGNFSLSAIGLSIEERISEDEWWAFFEAIRRIDTAIQWVIGDLVAYGEDNFETTYDEIAEVTGYAAETIENYAYVARKVPPSLRNDSLSFNHHYLVASLDTDEDRQRWLQRAEEHELSVADLRKSIGRWRDGIDPEPYIKLASEKKSPVVRAKKKMEDERYSVLKKAQQQGRDEWLNFVREQVEEWKLLAQQLETLDP